LLCTYFKLGLIIFVCWNVPRITTETLIRDRLLQRCTQPGRQVAMAVKFCTVAADICGDSMWNLLHVTLLASRILRWLPDVWRILCIPTLLLDIFFRNVQNMWRWNIIASTVKRPWAQQLRNNGLIPVWCKILLSAPKRLYRFWGLSPLYSPDMWNYFFFYPGVISQCMKPISPFCLMLNLRNVPVSPLTIVYIACSGTNLHCFFSSRIWCWNVTSVCVCFSVFWSPNYC